MTSWRYACVYNIIYVVGPTLKILRTRCALRFPAGGPCVFLFTVICKPRREGVKQTSWDYGGRRRGTEKFKKKKKKPFRLLIMTKYKFPRATIGDARSFYRTHAVYHVTFALLLLSYYYKTPYFFQPRLVKKKKKKEKAKPASKKHCPLVRLSVPVTISNFTHDQRNGTVHNPFFLGGWVFCRFVLCEYETFFLFSFWEVNFHDLIICSRSFK